MFLTINKKTIIVILAVLVVVVAISVPIGLTSTNATNRRMIPIYSVETLDNKVALTFDAAWGSDKTRGIMDELEKYGFKGTFFLTGFWVDANTELVKEIHARGHQVANHSENHKHLKNLSKEDIINEITLVNGKLEAITGEKATAFRAPFGEYDNRLITALNSENMACIQWDIDSLDWKGISGKEIVNRVQSKIKQGSIVLFHNNSDHVLDALPIVLLALKNKNLTSVRIDELIYKDNYVINNDGKQIKKS